MSERQRGDRSSDEAQDDQKNDSSKRDDPGGSRKQSRFGRIRARNNASREEGPGAARNEDSEPEAGEGGGDGDESDGQGERRDRSQPDVPPPRSPAQRLMEGGMATFDRMRKSLATNPKGGGEAKAEERQQQQRGAAGGPGSTVSALAAGVMDRSSKLKSQMMSMMDRSGGGGRPAGDAGKGKGDAGKEGKDDDGADADDEDPLQPSSSPERRQPTIRRTGSRLQRLSQRNNKENAPGEEAGGAGGEPAALDKLTQRLKRRGLTRRSSKEAGETNRRSEDEDDEEEDQEEPEHKAAASPDKAAASKPGVTFDPDRPYMRTVPTPALRARRQLLDRVMVEKVPELHIIGEITGALGFDSGISCRWILEMGKFWSHLAGEQYGQTHTVYPLPEDGDQALAVWNHPLDVHLTSASIQGWPRLIFQVSRLDELGRHTVVGYGFEHVPVMPGVHQLEVSCWRPTGSMQDELAAYFLGVTPQLLDTDVVFTRAWDKRCRLVTMPAGRIYLNLSIIARNFAEYDVDLM